MSITGKKVIYTVITNQYDHLFPSLEEQDGWDMICFTDDEGLIGAGWQVKPIPQFIQKQADGDAVKTARLVKLLPHRFLEDYEYSLYLDANRLLSQKADVFVEDCEDDIVCLGSLYVDAYAAVENLIFEETKKQEEDTELLFSQPKPLEESQKNMIEDLVVQWQKGGLPEYSGCPGTAVMGRRHNRPSVVQVMESWAEYVQSGLTIDEVAFPYACYKNGVQWTERLQQLRREKEMFSRAEWFAMVMQHVRIGNDTEEFEKTVYDENPPPPGGEYDGYPFLLTIGVPVSNQIGTIRRCLEGIKPILDALPSELLVVDTGSTDGTVEVCEEFGARVVKFPWINHMSAARNTGIKAAKGCWFMSIDDDEWFEDTTSIIHFFKSGNYKKYNMAMYNQRNFDNKNMTKHAQHPTPRMGKMTPGLHFEGRIHDALIQEGEVKRVYLEAVANHLGFASDDEDSLREKSRRNVRILKKEVAYYPEDLRFANQMVKEYLMFNRVSDSIRMTFWIMSLGKTKGHSFNWHWVKINIARTFRNMVALDGDGAQAIDYYERFLDLEEYNELDKCLVLGTLVTAHAKNAEAEVKNYQKAMEYAQEYFKVRKKFLSLKPGLRDLQFVTIGENSVNDETVALMAKQLMINGTHINKTKVVDSFVLSKDMLEFFCEEKNQDYRTVVMEYLLEMKKVDVMNKVLLHFKKKNSGQGMEYLYAMVCEKIDNEDTSEFEETLKKTAQDDEGFLAMLSLMKTDEACEKTQELYKKAIEYVKDTLFLPGNYFRGRLLHEALRLGLCVDDVFSLLDRSSMDYVLYATREKKTWRPKLRVNLLGYMAEINTEKSFLHKYLKAQLSEVVFREKEMNRELNAEEYLDEFEAYVKDTSVWQEEYFNGQILQVEDAVCLPAKMRAVHAAKKALDSVEAASPTDAMKSLKIVVAQEPSFKHAVAILNEKLMKDTKQELSRQSEMEMLLSGIKPKLKQMLADGQIAQLRAMIVQLEAIAPNDEDILEIKAQLNLLPPS